jgi:hypothetical protein
VIAYYLAGPRNDLRFPLFLTRFEKQRQEWQHASLSDLYVKISDGTEEETQADCIGSVESVERNRDWYFLNLHWNPSAGCLLILKHDLALSQTLAGWTSVSFKSGLLVYSGNAVHFAPVHPPTLFLYDPVTHKSQQLYPPKDDPFRNDFRRRLEQAIDQKRCAEHNWPCDPAEFTTNISSPMEVNNETKSLAFEATYSMEGFLTREEAESGGKWARDRYACVFELDPLRWREVSMRDLSARFATDSLENLLTPQKLKQVFASPSH